MKPANIKIQPDGKLKVRRHWWRVLPALITFVLGAAGAGFLAWKLRSVPPAPIVTQFSFSLADGQQFTSTGQHLLAISPDGALIAYVANSRLYLRRMGEMQASAIPGTESRTGVSSPVFSPDGTSIAFFSADDFSLKRISVTGGTAIPLCSATNPYGMSWSDEGILFAQDGVGIMKVSPYGGKAVAVIGSKEGEILGQPQMLPDGRTVLFSIATGTSDDRWDRAKIVAQEPRALTNKVLIDQGSEGHYVASGHLIYANSGTLRAVRFDLKELAVIGVPVTVVDGIRRTNGAANTGIAQMSVSRNGTLVYMPGPANRYASTMSLVLTDRSGKSEALKALKAPYATPRISPDGKHIAVQIDDGKQSNISIYDVDVASSLRRLTFGGNNAFPVWSPDSKTVAFQSDRDGYQAIYEQRADGSSPAVRLTKPEPGTSHFPNAWLSDGASLLFEIQDGSTRFLASLSLQDKQIQRVGDIKNKNQLNATVSPDGKWVAYTFNDVNTNRNQIYLQPLPPTGSKFQIPGTADVHDPVWSSDGKELIYATGLNRFASVTLTFEPAFAVSNPIEVFIGGNNNAPAAPRNFDLMPDGRHIINVLSMQDETTENATQIKVILNWFEDLKQRIPTKH